MVQNHALNPRPVAEELYRLLREMDPARWKDEWEGKARDRMLALRERLHQMLEDRALSAPSAEALKERLAELAHLIETAMPRPGQPVERLKGSWGEFRLKMVPAYERLAGTLSGMDIHVPSLRPTNYRRNVFHAFNGIWALTFVHHIMSMLGIQIFAVVFTTICWTTEFLRRRSPELNARIMRLFKPIAHPHETWRVNSATWYATSFLFLAFCGDLAAVSVALIVLALGDPAAAIIGRRFGRTKLVHGRSLEGTLAFVAFGALGAFVTLSIYHPEFTAAQAVAVAFAGAVPGALAELFSRRVDDNFSVPVCTATGVLVLRALAGF
ncbi:MAG: diacylglycerol/polyprenol kinase family protein [Bradymonadia bacterium]